MKLRKLLSTLVLSFIMVLGLSVCVSAATANITCNPASGSTVTNGQKLKVRAELMEGSDLVTSYGFTSFETKLYDKETGKEIDEASNFITLKTPGNNPVANEVIVPAKCSAKELKLVATVKDNKGQTYTKEFTFKGPNAGGNGSQNDGDPTKPNNSNVLTITADVPSESVIKPASVVKFTTTSSNKYVGTKTCHVVVTNDKTGELFKDVSRTTDTEAGANPFNYNITMPEEEGRYKVVVTSTDINGVKATKTFYYIVEANEDKDYYEGIINPDLEGLVIDLWLMKDTRFYELNEDDIPFVAYYYNAEKKDAKNVTIEVEVPDGFKVVSKSTPYGDVKVKNDTIVYNIGTVPSREVRPVYFTLKATDDDTCEVITNVTAVILQDDDYEDQSTQRVLIYEEGGKGEFKAYVTGYPDQTFRADNDITREEVAAIMARAFNHTTTDTTKNFTDVKKTSWSYNYIMACVKANIVTGYPNNTFKPFGNITRAELYAMTYRAMDISQDEKALFVPKKYKNLDSWEKNYMAGLVRLKMLTDMKDTEPSEQATRAEVVYLVNGVQMRNPSKKVDITYTDLRSSHWCARGIQAASVNYSYKRGADGEEIMITK